ncbi:15109_t:CDS:1, partial [Cetraspora pellucida]
NIEKALIHYKKSADLGYNSAILMIYTCYFNGLGVEKDEEKAYTYTKKYLDRMIND